SRARTSASWCCRLRRKTTKPFRRNITITSRGIIMSQSLRDKVIFVTGASSGIGRETSLDLARQGAVLVLADVNEKDGLSLVEEIQAAGGRARFVKLNVCDGAAVAEVVAGIAETEGRLDVAINNAGVEHANQRLADIDEK